ncbi:MAG: hypothetical protein ACI9GW_003385 [Halieaceae bacterium]|jgi:hypothetical protein
MFRFNHSFLSCRGLYGITLLLGTSFLFHLTDVSAQGTATYHFRHPFTGEYMTQGGYGDDAADRSVWLAPLNKKLNPDPFRWVLTPAKTNILWPEYFHIVYLKNGLVLGQSSEGRVGNWGLLPSDEQRWRIETLPGTNPVQKVFVMKSNETGLGVHSGGAGGNRQVTYWPRPKDNKGFGWILEEAGEVDLIKLRLEYVRCIKPSTGMDGATMVLFMGIDAAIQAGAAAATGGASAAGSAALAGQAVTRAAVLKAAKKKALDTAQGAIKEAAENEARRRAANAVLGEGGAATLEDLSGQPKQAAMDYAPAGVKTAMDVSNALDAVSAEGIFNEVYGESPDDLEIRVNGVSVWPNGGRDHRTIKSQQVRRMNTDYIFERSKGLRVDLVEYDSGSDDDHLGGFNVNIGQLQKRERFVDVLVQDEDEGSIYELTFTVEPLEWYAEQHERALQAQADIVAAKADREAAEAKMKVDNIAATTPASAVLSLESGAESGNRIPIGPDDPNPEGLLVKPAIMLTMTFVDGSEWGIYYQNVHKDTVVFDDVSGDPNDLIKVIYSDNGIGAWLAATGNGVGTAQLKVSFSNAPGVTASVAVEVVDTEPKPVPVIQQVAVNPRAEFLNGWAARQRGNLSFPHTADVFQVSQIYSRCSSGCEMVYPSEDILIVMGMPDYAQTDISMEEVDARVGHLFLAGYCGGEGKKENALLSFAVGDKYGARIANTTFNPVDCEATQASPAQVLSASASNNASAQSFNQLAEESRAEIPLPFTAGVFEMREIYSICPSGCEQDYGEAGLAVAMALPAIGASDVSKEEVDGAIAQLLGPTYCAGDVKKKNGVMWIAVDDMHGTRVSDIRFAPADCPAGTEHQAQTPSYEGGNARNEPSTQNQINHTAQLFNGLAEGSRAEMNLPLVVDVFEMTHIYSMCPSGCEQEYGESGLFVIMAMPNHGANEVSMEEIDAHVGQVLGATYCAGDVKKGNGVMQFAINGKHGARVANTLFRPTDCNTASAIVPTTPSVQAPVEQQVEFVPSQQGIVASSEATSEVTQFALYNDWNFNWAVAWVDGNGTVTAGSPSIVPGGAWRIENGARGWGWYTIYTPERYLCSFSPKQGASINISQLSACGY